VDIPTLAFALVDADEEVKDRVLSFLAKRALKAYEEFNIKPDDKELIKVSRDKLLKLVQENYK
jgi:hypothetical protein